MDELKILGYNLSQFRKKNNFSYQAMGDALGISAAHVCRIENATAKPSFDVLIAISRLMDVPLYYLFLNSAETPDLSHFISLIKAKLAELNWSPEKLSQEVGLNLFKVLDILQERVHPTLEEINTIADKLLIPLPGQPINQKLSLLEKLLSDLGLDRQQVENISNYVLESIQKENT